MSEVALYRKYRPQKFSEVVGQEHIVAVLSASLKQGKIGHAYLFHGSRGTGKTSVARILAKALQTSDKDIYEMDAASNRGIEEVRALREAVHTLPFDSAYKVYIIDEFHMMTREAFNALLKTLEEPPSHVIFILATTEFHKLPETIISRCETHHFKRPADEDVRKVLVKVAKAEGYSLDKDSLNLITLLGEGSFRDALGTLQKVFTISADKKITVDEVEKITGAPRQELINQLLEAIINGRIEDSMKLVEQAAEAGLEMKILVKVLLRSLRLLMLLAYAPELEKRIAQEVSEEELDFLRKLAAQKPAVALSAILKEFLVAHQEIGSAYIKQLPLELALVRILGQTRLNG